MTADVELEHVQGAVLVLLGKALQAPCCDRPGNDVSVKHGTIERGVALPIAAHFLVKLTRARIRHPNG